MSFRLKRAVRGFNQEFERVSKALPGVAERAKEGAAAVGGEVRRVAPGRDAVLGHVTDGLLHWKKEMLAATKGAAEQLSRLDATTGSSQEQLTKVVRLAEAATRRARAEARQLEDSGRARLLEHLRDSAVPGTDRAALLGRFADLDRTLRADLRSMEEAAAGADQLVEAAQRFLATQGQSLLDVWDDVKEMELFKAGVDALARFLMDTPRIEACPSGCSAKPVYYVNGILTQLDAAKQQAAPLERCVWLIHNPSKGLDEDLAEAFYDRTWPITLGSIRLSKDELVRFLRGDLELELQRDPVVRQLTHLVYHAQEPIQLVSHSQGCLQVRNALLTAALFRGERWVRKHVIWVATGVPMLAEEVLLRPDAFVSLVNPGDPVARWIGLRGGRGAFTQADLDAHSFASYADQVREELDGL